MVTVGVLALAVKGTADPSRMRLKAFVLVVTIQDDLDYLPLRVLEPRAFREYEVAEVY